MDHGERSTERMGSARFRRTTRGDLYRDQKRSWDQAMGLGRSTSERPARRCGPRSYRRQASQGRIVGTALVCTRRISRRRVGHRNQGGFIRRNLLLGRPFDPRHNPPRRHTPKRLESLVETAWQETGTSSGNPEIPRGQSAPSHPRGGKLRCRKACLRSGQNLLYRLDCKRRSQGNRPSPRGMEIHRNPKANARR